MHIYVGDINENGIRSLIEKSEVYRVEYTGPGNDQPIEIPNDQYWRDILQSLDDGEFVRAELKTLNPEMNPEDEFHYELEPDFVGDPNKSEDLVEGVSETRPVENYQFFMRSDEDLRPIYN